MAGRPGLINKCLVGGLNLLFLLLIPYTRAEGGGGGGVLQVQQLYDDEPIVRASPPPPEADDYNNPPPLFTLTFNVEEYDDHRWEETYGGLMRDLRTRLGSGSRWERLGVPVLHEQAPDGEMPTRWFHLVLRRGADGTNVTLRVRGDNLYVVGLRRDGGATDDGGRWWECRKEDKKKPKPPLIRGSMPLGFSCNYNHIEGTAGQKTTEVGLGRHRLRDAVSQLANVRELDRSQEPTARSVMVLIIMVAEATRFREISDHFVRDRGVDDPNRTVRLSERMDALIRGWGDISERVFRSDQNPERSSETFPLEMRRGATVVVLSTAHAAELLLGILLLPRFCPWRPGPRINNNNESHMLQQYNNYDDHHHHDQLLEIYLLGGGGGAGAGHEQHCAEGRPLLEVISVVMNDIDGENPGDLYGTIRVTDALGTQSLYDRGRKNYESVYPGGAATLTGPAERAISAALATVTFDLDLWDRDFLTDDDPAVRGAFEWDHLAFAKRSYDTRLSQTIRGPSGSATVNYIVFSDAVEAKFQVTLVQGDDGKQDQVFGRIVARIGDLGIESVLLSTTSSHYSDVWYGSLIPLQRTRVAVPLSSYIRVSALLYDYDTSSAADEIAGGCTYFGAKSSGTTRWRITGQSGVIEVKVIWNPSY